jgi:hypothetical protein
MSILRGLACAYSQYEVAGDDAAIPRADKGHRRCRTIAGSPRPPRSLGVVAVSVERDPKTLWRRLMLIANPRGSSFGMAPVDPIGIVV